MRGWWVVFWLQLLICSSLFGADRQSTIDRQAIERYVENLQSFARGRTLHTEGEHRVAIKVPPGYSISLSEPPSNEWSEQQTITRFDLYMQGFKFREKLDKQTHQGKSQNTTVQYACCDGTRRLLLRRLVRSSDPELFSHNGNRWTAVIDCGRKKSWYNANPSVMRHGGPIRVAFFNLADLLNEDPFLPRAVQDPAATVGRETWNGQECIVLEVDPHLDRPATDWFYFTPPPKLELVGFVQQVGTTRWEYHLTWTRNRHGQPALETAKVLTGAVKDREFRITNAVRVEYERFEFIDPPPDFKWLVDIPAGAEIDDHCEESPIPTTMEVVEQEQKAERRWWLLVLGIVLAVVGLAVGAIAWRRRYR